jgi:hypothetical protein
MNRRKFPWSRVSLIGIGAFCGAVIFDIIIQVIGNHADTGITWLIGQIGNSVQQNSFPWIIVVLLILVCIVALLYSRQRVAILRRTLDQSNKMLALDDSLLRLLAIWTPPTNSSGHSDQLKLILKEILKDSTVEFEGHVERAAILLPDRTGTFLRCWSHYQMPQESIDSMEFYIGNDSQTQRDKGGVAGASFRSGEILVGHMSKQANGQWTCDQEHFVKFQGTRPFCPYSSFVTVPVIGISAGTNIATCLGVVCFDSKRDNSFDSAEIKLVLGMIARRVASTLLISEKLP